MKKIQLIVFSRAQFNIDQIEVEEQSTESASKNWKQHMYEYYDEMYCEDDETLEEKKEQFDSQEYYLVAAVDAPGNSILLYTNEWL